jgi:hypothetical protein
MGGGDEDPDSEIEFAAFVEEGSLDVFLGDPLGGKHFGAHKRLYVSE